MVESVKLFNKGKRNIAGLSHDGKPFELTPEKAMAFHPDDASKLQRLYGDELISMNDVVKQFDNAPVEAKTPATAPVKTDEEILAELEAEQAAAAAAAEAEAKRGKNK